MNELALGIAAEDAGSLNEAAWRYERAAGEGNPDARLNLGVLELKRANFSAAESAFGSLVDSPDYRVDAHRGLAQIRLEQARVAEAVGEFALAGSDSERLYYGLHLPPDEQQWYLHRQWALHFCTKKRLRCIAPKLNWDGKRPLRVGYLGARMLGPIMRFLTPVLAHHDPAKVEAIVFDASPSPDDARAANLDIAVDLLGHMGCGANVPCLVDRVAPILCSYLVAYGTGLADVWRISDAVCDPIDEDIGGERIIRLPGCYCAYAPDADAPEPELMPHEGIVFASLNRACKITAATARAWGRIIAAEKSHRLAVLAHGGENNIWVREMLTAAGVPGERLTLVPKMPRAEYLRFMGGVDVVLDVVDGYGGHTTVCDALWQGVPVMTMRGTSMRGRAGADLLRTVAPGFGMESLATSDPSRYVAAAIHLAGDALWRNGLRRDLRAKMRDTLGDGRRVAASLEAAYRQLAENYDPATTC